MEVKRLHIPAIDTLRGVAASLVCFYHFVCTTTGYIESESILDFFHLGYYGVHMFFVISGVVIPLSMIIGGYTYDSWFRFIKKRFIRIEPPYLVSVLIATAYLIIRNYIPGTTPVDMSPDALTLFLHVGYLVPFFEGFHWVNNVYWSLAVEFQYYILLCLIFPLFLKRKLWMRIPIYLFFWTAAYMLPIMRFLPIWLPMFMVGISYVLWRYEYIQKLEFLIVLSISLVMTYVHIDLNAALFGAGTLAIIHFLPQLRNKASRFLGDISYSLYLLHTIIGSAFINYLSHSFKLGWQKVLIISLGYVFSVLAAYILFKWVEKPSKRWSSKVNY